MPTKINIENKRFGRLVAIKPTNRRSSSGSIIWKCVCDCKKVVFVPTDRLRGRNTMSCGCFRKDIITTHGLYGTPEYGVWISMKQRCHNKNNKYYEDYGGRGIKVCKLWRKSFVNFYSDMGKRPSPELSIERINNDKGYFSKNCKWATIREQLNNRRNQIKRRAIKSEY